jgi:V/A-type H+-transporting ATPase subunit I
MIAQIKKYNFLVHHSDYTRLLNILRNAGVVHIVEKRKLDESSPAAGGMINVRKYRETIRRIKGMVQEVKEEGNFEDPEKVQKEFDSQVKEIEEAGHHIELLKNEAEKASPWGCFDIDTIRKLSEAGWNISLFSCPEKSFDQNWKEKYALEIINRKRGRFFFAVAHKEEDLTDIRAEEVSLPDRDISAVLKELEEYEEKIEVLKSAIKTMAPLWINSLNMGIRDAVNNFEYSLAKEQVDKYADNNLYVLEGWIPIDEAEKVEDVLQQASCYYFSSEPGPDEKIPVILENNRFSRLFEPISKLFALPNYRELDLTPFFAPFFMLFFGFCLGDAGYGLIFIIAGFIIKRKIDKSYRPVITLAQYFGAAAVIMGLLSGTLFGMNLIDTGYTITEHSLAQMKEQGLPANTLSDLSQIKDVRFETRQNFAGGVVDAIGGDDYSKFKNTIIKNAKPDFAILSSFRHFMLDSINMFYLAILLGALQIIFGMILKIVNIARLKGFKHSLSTIGWVLLIMTLVIFVGGDKLNLVDKEKMKPLYIGFLAIAGILIFFLNSPGKNIFVRVGLGIWDSYGIVTGVFGDLLSYIRLFALGISSSILGFVFNEISMEMLSVPYLGWLLFAVLLLIGHTLNIAIAALGSFVHPMRLTFVEFYKNAGFTGGGIEYKPFKIRK